MKSGSVNEQRGSVLLKPEENEQLFRLIGNRCQCLAAGIIQLYLTEPPHNEWIKRSTGIITLIRDTSKRSFFLRLYCIQRKAMLWEHEVYNSMEYKAPVDYFHTFEAEDCMAAFNFASETDAIVLRSILVEKLNARARRRNDRHSKMEMDNQRGVTLPRKNQSISTPSLGLPNASDSFPNGSSMSISVNRSMSNISMTKIKKKKRKQEAKKKLTTNDIGLPFDFRHVEHVGTDINNCRVVDPTLKAFFDKVGIKESHLENEETRDFIYDFIERYGGMNAVKKEIIPSPVAQTNPQQQVPKPQPKLEPPPPVPARTIPVSTNTLSNNPNKILPGAPPPPPMPSFSSDPVETLDTRGNNDLKQAPDPRSMLMESIRSGISLKKVNKEETVSPKTDNRSNLLDEIRQGITLKPVANEPRPTSATPNETEGLIGALKRALQDRSKAMYSESEDSSEFSDNDDEWDD
ncbi:hypothetical protein QAD02_018088 [Eretmocerus hayati]|uniref:Uncharacterized protein n=1 Tax=Eretmocerus hayati TaxID=131215 RepID=A0ACC2PFN8_9HYME|nr:hypothetical protein QAD02_018088 [Eretmocerus hayati]